MTTKTRGRPARTRILLPALLLLAVWAAGAAETPDDPRAGLILTFSAPGPGAEPASDTLVTPNVQLFAPAGKPATPFVFAGKFEAVWTGSVSMELRSDYAFQAELNGTVKVEIGSQIVLEGMGNGSAIPHGRLIRLGKGDNPVKITFSSPEQGDAFLRLYWSDKPEKNIPFDLVPNSVWNHGADTPALLQARQWRLGREIMLERRCFKCHETALPEAGPPEFGMDAPALDGIGSLRRVDWMADWIREPAAARPTARMPRLLHGPKAKEEAEAIAAYLASLREAVAAPGGAAAPADANRLEAGEMLFTTLNCAGCHLPPDATEPDATKIPLKRIAEKFSSGALAAFLGRPEARYAWIRMPNFKFNPEEAATLADYLLSKAEPPKEEVFKASEGLVAEGKKLVQTSGCLKCHGLKEENRFSAGNLASLVHWDQGCLAAAPKDDARAPFFAFAEPERAAIQAFVTSPVFLHALQTHAPAEFADRQTRLLNCRACHGVLEGFPPLEILGGKLKPEWMQSFIAGEVAYKPRHWLPARMPAFKARAPGLASGLVMEHGTAPASPAESPVNPDLAAVGRKLISVNGGFSCVQCHSVNKAPAIQVFESEGINLAYSAARLQKAYYERWVRNPQSIEPLTKMPRFFSEDDKSPLADILGGDIQKQVEAMWNYLRLGDKMQPPPGPDGR